MSDDRSKPLLTMDPLMGFAVLGLMAIGIMFVYSSGVNSNGVSVSSEYIRQLLWAVVALVFLVSFSYINYNLLRDLSFWVYAGFLVLLVLTLLFGRVVNGAKSWIGIMGLGGQPSEFCKIATILFLARFLSNKRAEIQNWRVFLQAFLIVLVPMGLILRQPDTGTTLVFLPVFLIMVFMAGGKVRHIFYVTLVGILSIVLALVPFVESIIYKEASGLGMLLTDLRVMGVVAAVFAAIVVLATVGFLQFKQRVYYWLI